MSRLSLYHALWTVTIKPLDVALRNLSLWLFQLFEIMIAVVQKKKLEPLYFPDFISFGLTVAGVMISFLYLKTYPWWIYFALGFAYAFLEEVVVKSITDIRFKVSFFPRVNMTPVVELIHFMFDFVLALIMTGIIRGLIN